MLTRTILYAICAVFRIPILVKCIDWTPFKELEVYGDKLCSISFVEHKLFSSNRLSCLVSCRHTAGCNKVIYDRKSTTCYRLRSGFQHDDCLTELVGARLYQNVYCPDGWKNINSACYVITDKKENRATSLASCKNFHRNAQLAGAELGDELRKVRSWIFKEHPQKHMWFWTGATRVGEALRWGDGTPFDNHKWDKWKYNCSAVDIRMEIAASVACETLFLKGLCRMVVQ